MTEGLSTLYQDFLGGSCDCVDRIVLNAYLRMGRTLGPSRDRRGPACATGMPREAKRASGRRFRGCRRIRSALATRHGNHRDHAKVEQFCGSCTPGDIGVVTLQCVGNPGQPGSAALSDVPSKQPHCPDDTPPRAPAVGSLALINRHSAVLPLRPGALVRPAALRSHRGTGSSNPHPASRGSHKPDHRARASATGPDHDKAAVGKPSADEACCHGRSKMAKVAPPMWETSR